MNGLGLSMYPVELHLVSWNRPDMTELVIRTIHRNTSPKSFRLVVLDNGSSGETVEMLTNLHDNGLIDELHLKPTNIGLEAARQFLLKEATTGSYFICVDNDCLPPTRKDGQDWVQRLVELMQKYEEYAAISCRTQVMIGTGNIFETADLEGDEITPFPHPGGSLRIMRSGVVRDVGGWDRQAEGRGAEERFICGKLNSIGYMTGFATQIRTLHLFGNREKTKERWGYEDSMSPEETGHSDIYHPALINGDDYEEVSLYSGIVLADKYFGRNK